MALPFDIKGFMSGGGLIMRTSQRLAIDRYGLAVQTELQMCDPQRQTGLQLCGVENTNTRESLS